MITFAAVEYLTPWPSEPHYRVRKHWGGHWEAACYVGREWVVLGEGCESAEEAMQACRDDAARLSPVTNDVGF